MVETFTAVKRYPGYYTVIEASCRTGIPVQSLYFLIKREEIPAEKVGIAFLIPNQAVDDIMESIGEVA
ncbi:excisionase family DNA-binding protein [Methanocalculus sp.]|uniref:excisionase family DNA-binding protein n=1 Tax=Methanocalculus sp. TaxID=2004547 RepID=UPI002621D3D4|nr:excisionase family DNA-binding protein [Methanocalculus sp.]MDG6251732.1 excisionase family DNA-binding protein [Methanocalculus sp.]